MKEFIKKHKNILSLMAVFAVVGGFAFFYLSYNILATVSGFLIWRKDFDRVSEKIIAQQELSGEYKFTTNFPKEDFYKNKELMTAVQKEALSQMIEYRILTAGLDELVSDWETLAIEKIENALGERQSQSNVAEGVRYLYDMEMADFKSEVLLPQAQFEILSEELKKQNQNYEDWIKDKRKTAKVKIFIDGLKWEEGEVMISD